MTTICSADIGLQLAQDKEFDKAIQEFTLLISQDQTYADGYFYRGCAYLHLFQYEKAIEDFSSAIPSIKLSAKYELRAFYKRGYAYYKTNQFDSALEDYRHYIILCKRNQEQMHLHKGIFQMGNIHAALNENSSAISYFTDAIKTSQDTEEAGQKLYYLHRARAYACLAKYNEAQSDLDKVIQQSNDSFIKGCAYNELGQHENALQEFDSLAQSNGNTSKLVEGYHHHILFRQGLSYASLNLHDEAMNHFQLALDHSERQTPSDITDRIRYRKGITNMELNHPHRALFDFNKSTELNDKQSDVFYARSMFHSKVGRHDAAVIDQRKAMELERKFPSSIQQTIYHTHKQGDTYIYYENKQQEADKLLNKYEGTSLEPEIYHAKARYAQRQAPYSGDAQRSYGKARGYLKTANKLSCESPVRNSVAMTNNSFLTACDLAEKYFTTEMPVSDVERYIGYSVESMLNMSKLFDQYIQKDQNWHELIDVLKTESSRVNEQQTCKSGEMLIEFIKDQLERIATIREAPNLFQKSQAQQEFFALLLTRLRNLFDAVRLASTGIFAHQLGGNCTKVSWLFKLLGKLFQFVPIGSQYGPAIFGICQSGFKRLDETRIQNALDYLGRQCTPMIAHQIAETIAREVTEIYEDQIKKFPTTSEEEAANDAANKVKEGQQASSVCCNCAGCISRCCQCLDRQTNYVLNSVNFLTMRTIVEYGTSLALSCLVKFETTDAKNAQCIQNAFINSICRPSKAAFFQMMTLSDKIKPTDAETGKQHWDTYDFFRRPGIIFADGTKRARKQADLAKFGCRKPTSEEKHLHETKPEELDKLGFKTIIS